MVLLEIKGLTQFWSIFNSNNYLQRGISVKGYFEK